jgi:hypothetical protein
MAGAASSDSFEQITFGPKHHFFGYIGQCRTIPWSGDGRYILGLETGFIDRMPEPEDAAGIVLIDTQEGNKIIRVDSSRAWNPQQGTMFYWRPGKTSEFLFNDRDQKSGKVFAVLHDATQRKRVREYRFDDTPVGTWRSKEVRLDPAPCWNRTGDAILVTGLANDGTRQMFLYRIGK